MEVGLGPGDFMLDEVSTPPPQKGGRVPQLSAHVYCGQTAGWIKIATGMELSLCPRYIVLDGDPAPLPKKWTEPPIFSAPFYCGKTLGCIKMPKKFLFASLAECSPTRIDTMQDINILLCVRSLPLRSLKFCSYVR